MVILINCRIEILYVRSWNEISKNPRFFRMNLVYEDTPRKEIQEFFERKVEIENLRNRNEPTIPSFFEVEKKTNFEEFTILKWKRKTTRKEKMLFKPHTKYLHRCRSRSR